ncbi:MAG: lipid-A-disaccharide synthase [Lysobacterales bacterium]
MAQQAPVIALVAGEASGDQLGAALVERLRRNWPQARFVGVGGRRMRDAGVDAWWDSQELAVMGLFEVLKHFPRLLKLRRELTRRLLALRPDLFIGIDAPDFNLGLEIKLRRAGIRTAHYVSPTVWAWRRKRVRKIGRAADLVLCLFPFEPAFYRDHGVAATYVGHPLADQIEPCDDPARQQAYARAALGLTPAATTIALLPGSRVSEVELLAPPMIAAAARLCQRRPDVQFVAALANDRVAACFGGAMEAAGFPQVTLTRDRPRDVLAAADVVLCASGTATLETMLVNRPLVMAYRLNTATYLAAKHLRLIRPQLFALPNILAGERLVAELLQGEASGERLAEEAERWLDEPERAAELRRRFRELHEELRCDASGRAAAAVSGLLHVVEPHRALR